MIKLSVLLVYCAAISYGAHAMPYGLADMASFLENMQDFLQDPEYRERCVTRSGSDLGLNKSLASLGPATECMEENINVTQITAMLPLANKSPEERKPVFEENCPKIKASVHCFEDVIEGAIMCTDTFRSRNDDVVTMKKMLLKIIHNFIDQICESDGESLSYRYTRYEQMVMNDKDGNPVFKECVIKSKVLRYLFPMNIATDCKFPRLSIAKPISQYDENDCSTMQQARTCFQKQVDEGCYDSYELDMYDVFYQPLVEAANCPRFSSFSP